MRHTAPLCEQFALGSHAGAGGKGIAVPKERVPKDAKLLDRILSQSIEVLHFNKGISETAGQVWSPATD